LKQRHILFFTISIFFLRLHLFFSWAALETGREKETETEKGEILLAFCIPFLRLYLFFYWAALEAGREKEIETEVFGVQVSDQWGNRRVKFS
jgi:hypothetical protein